MDPSQLSGRWNYPTAIRFGPGMIEELPLACSELGLQRPLLVTDPGLAELPPVAQALEINREAGVPTGLFKDVQPNPRGIDVDLGVQALKDGKHDGVIAMGGGSALDVGKAIALMAGQSRPLWDFEDRDDWWTRADERSMVPLVAVPTTSGTGSEVGRCSVIVNEAEQRKVIIFHPKMMPARVVAAPRLTLWLPAGITAGVGMDALAHNLEAFCVPSFHPQADGIALEGMRLVHRSLRDAVLDGDNLQARADMMVAATMGATAFQKGLGAIHALSHPVGVALHAHHGTTNGVVMPYVLLFNRPAIEERMQHLARFLDLPGSGFDAVLRWVLELREAIEIPHTLKGLGMDESQCAEFAPAAAVDPTAPTNPVPVHVDNLELLYRRSLSGDLSA